MTTSLWSADKLGRAPSRYHERRSDFLPRSWLWLLVALLSLNGISIALLLVSNHRLNTSLNDLNKKLGIHEQNVHEMKSESKLWNDPHRRMTDKPSESLESGDSN